MLFFKVACYVSPVWVKISNEFQQGQGCSAELILAKIVLAKIFSAEMILSEKSFNEIEIDQNCF